MHATPNSPQTGSTAQSGRAPRDLSAVEVVHDTLEEADDLARSVAELRQKLTGDGYEPESDFGESDAANGMLPNLRYRAGMTRSNLRAAREHIEAIYAALGAAP